MGLTERHWFEDEEPELTEYQLHDRIRELDEAYKKGYESCREKEVPKWISVKDRLPEEKENWITKDFQGVICCCDFGGAPRRIDVRTYGFGRGHFWHGPQIMDDVVTHWMYLPTPPKED